MPNLNYWFDVPTLCTGPFLAINISNRKSESKAGNDKLLPKKQTGNWQIPKSALAAGIENQIVVLFYTLGGLSTLYTGICKSKKVAGATKHNQPRYLLTMTEPWKQEGTTESNFTKFFSGFTISANPTVVWATANEYNAPASNQDGSEESDPDDDDQKGVGGANVMALVAQRARHDLFAKRVKKVWGKQCALTGLSAPRLVQACHLVPWVDAEPLEQTSGHNGLMLCAHLHALLDSHLISFDDEGKLLLASGLDSNLRRLVLVGGRTSLRKRPAKAQTAFLKRHRAAAELKGQNLVLATRSTTSNNKVRRLP